MSSSLCAVSPHSLHMLLIEDDKQVRQSLTLVLENSGYLVTAAATGEEGLEQIKSSRFDLILCDLRLPGVSGLEILQQRSDSCPFILMTAYGSTDIATQAVRAGAYDYISKPIVPDDLIFTLKRFEEHERLRRENESLKASLSEKYSFNKIVAQSQSFKSIFDTIRRLAPYNTTVMVTGESGTGKELVARAIHESSSRKGKPFVAINCGAIPESLMESELFGHRRGAFTDASRDKKGLFEEASGGTLFLDEIGELPLHLQVKLLRAIQEQHIRRVGDEQLISIDVRIVSATLRNLEEDVKKNRFREDLFYRLNVVSVHIPPLRERPEDIAVLIEHFMQKHSKRLGLAPKQLPPHILQALISYSWRGNARELENCIERALVLSCGDSLEVGALPPHISKALRTGKGDSGGAPGMMASEDANLSIKQRTRDLETQLIRKALEKTNGNRTHAAKILELSHRALLYKLKEYGL